MSSWPREAWPPLLAGLYWLWSAPEHGLVGFLFSVLPGCLMLASGVSMLLMPGDRRTAQWGAAGGVLGLVFALPAFVVLGFGNGLLLWLAAAAGFVAAGWHSIELEPHHEGVPEVELSPAVAAQVAVDEALLAEMLARTSMPDRLGLEEIDREIGAARELYRDRGWLDDPKSFHQEPPQVDKASLEGRSLRSLAYEHLKFESEYEPYPEEPGRERWLGYSRNRTAHAWVLRHAGEDRPWLLCAHGYVMGWPLADFAVFRPDILHERFGMNLIMPTLPLHGKRAHSWRSGEGFFGADTLDMIHAEAQAMWDMRRCLAWVRAQTPQPIGVYGLSLGGYTAALLASLDPQLACVVAGVPVSDFARIVFRHGPPLSLRLSREVGVVEERMREVKRVISPLAMQPNVAHEHRHIFGGVADRIVPPEHVRDLWRHWDQPEIVWYQGGHVTFRAHSAVARMTRNAFAQAGLLSHV